MSQFETRARAAIAAAEQGRKKRTRVRQMLVLAAPFCALVMFVSVTRKQVDDDPVGVVTAATQWSVERPVDYVMTYERFYGDEVLGPATVAVAADAVVGYQTTDPRLEDSVVLTVDNMLLLIEQQAVADDVDVVQVHFDPALGRPTEATFDRGGAYPDLWGFRVLAFEASASS
jgi:hypothetical protein